MVLMACTRHTSDPRLLAINRTIEESPRKALSELKKINPDSLDKDSRHIRDLLIIKASDKAYITHTSDSLILDVLDYFESHKEDPYYPEALYYGGRVYSDLGDLPTALDFFRKAADNLSSVDNNLKFRATILSQLGVILNRLRLHKESNNCLKEVVNIDRELNDTVNLPVDIMVLAINHINNNNYSLASDLIVESLKNNSLSEENRRNLFVLLAVTKYKTENIDEALRIIRNEGKALTNDELSNILAYRTQIYYRAGMLDSAYVMAKRLIHHPEYINKRIGYRILNSPEIRPRIPIDSLNHYIDEYSDGMESYLDENANQAALMQQTSYNYSKYARSNEKILKKYSQQRVFLIIFFVIATVSCVAYIILRHRNKRKIKSLQIDLENITQLRNEEVATLKYRLEKIEKLRKEENISLQHQIDELSKSKYEEVTALQRKLEEFANQKDEKITVLEQRLKEMTNLTDYDVFSSKKINSAGKSSDLSVKTISNIDEFRKEVVKELKMRTTDDMQITLPSEILNSDIYNYVKDLIQGGHIIPDEETIWREIKTVIINGAPNFSKKLNILSEGKLSIDEYKTILLIRLGIGVTHISVLTGKTKAAIISRKKSISSKIFGMEISNKKFDSMIQLL